VENSLFFLAKAYKKMGHNVLIVASDIGPGSKANKLPANDVIDGINVLRFKTQIPTISILKIRGQRADVSSCASVFKGLDFKPDLVVTRHHVTGLAAIKAGFKNIIYLIPGVIKFQETPYLKFNGNLKSNLKNLIIKFLILPEAERIQKSTLKKVNKIFVFSSNMKNQVLDILPDVTNKIFLTQPGIDPDFFRSDQTQREAREKIGINAEAFVFLTLARLTAHKFLDMAIEAFAIIDNKKAILLIVGDGPEKIFLENLAAERNLTGRVFFAGKTDDPVTYYVASNVFLLPSRHETFGQTIVEALVMGLPVVAIDSNEDGILTASSEIITNDVYGVLTKNNLTGYAAGMESVMQNHPYYNINRAEIVKRYSWDKLAAELIVN
jgi:1,2-diacylglycerol 3-alpha-glucosyltransferase